MQFPHIKIITSARFNIFQETNFANEVLDCLQNSKPSLQYSENVRQFSIALFFYSPNAYRYIRSVFNNHLPNPRTMRSWLESVDSSPGVTKSSLDALKIKVEEYEANKKKLIIALMCDEMSIKKKSGVV